MKSPNLISNDKNSTVVGFELIGWPPITVPMLNTDRSNVKIT